MLKSHDKFHSSSGKRLILVADDEAINREMLGMILSGEYEIIYAADGQETVDMVREHKDDLSLVLLDLMMPVKSGMEALKELKASPELKHIPVIVLTADQNAEIESLSYGAIDYIPKPYPQTGIMLARILKAIELSEDREIIMSTERDSLTGLYNREYFYRYAEQYDQHHKDKTMDAIVVDINHFHMINERFGRTYGDEILRRIGERIRETIADTDGIVCRREADTFMAYCPHGKDYKLILENASIGLAGDEAVNSRVRLRMGVYENVDKSLDIERRFDRAKMAADKVKGSFTKTIGIYDSTLHEQELYAEQLIDDFHHAIDTRQFKVFFQPKFDIRPKAPVLSSAEALVRWFHPDLGMISPGIFIPLFEDNGLIQELDRYVWRETAARIRQWRDTYGITIPVSVNVSRIDMYDPNLLANFKNILVENDLQAEDLLLEITESAYTKDSEQIIETVNQLRQLGFRIEMDDFGTGYSSLNMISSLPIDTLKLDMQFVRSAFKEQKDTRMLEVIIDIADHLGVPVIAEGVETEEQLIALKALGCDIVQGFYFSKPVPAEDYAHFVEIRSTLSADDLLAEVPEEETAAEAETPKAGKRERRSVRLKAVNYIFAGLAFVLAAAVALAGVMINRGYHQLAAAESRYNQAVLAAEALSEASDYLTEKVWSFVVTGRISDLKDYIREAGELKRRDNALDKLYELMADENSDAYKSLSAALDYSNQLMQREYSAIRMIQLAEDIPDADVPEVITSAALTAADADLPPEEMKAAAEELVFDETYVYYKDQIRYYVGLCTSQIIEESGGELERVQSGIGRIILIQNILLVALALAVLGEVIYITFQVRVPISRLVEKMRRQQNAYPEGAEEPRFVTRTYNEILEENLKAHRQLSYEATHDPLTGLHNRSAYETFMENADKDHIALLIIDVDKFKTINDTYGHDVGDRILKKVGKILTDSFRSVDGVFRLGGDEFIIVMTRANSSMRQLVINKIALANHQLQNPKDGLPRTSLSVGVAFSDREEPGGDIFKDADTALYRIKQGGRCGCAVY